MGTNDNNKKTDHKISPIRKHNGQISRQCPVHTIFYFFYFLFFTNNWIRIKISYM